MPNRDWDVLWRPLLKKKKSMDIKVDGTASHRAKTDETEWLDLLVFGDGTSRRTKGGTTSKRDQRQARKMATICATEMFRQQTP